MKFKILTLLLSLSSLLGMSQNDDWKTFEKDNFSIQYPTNWTYSDQKPQPNIQFVLMAEEASQTEDLFRENINLNTEDLNGQEVELDEYIDVAFKLVQKQFPDAKMVSNKDISLNGMEAKATEAIIDFGNGAVLKFKQYVMLYAGSAYILTFSSSTAEYDKYVEEATTILDTFKINS